MSVELALSFKQVSKIVGDLFGKREILHDISFSVAPRTVCGLVGHNGAGKSSLISLAVGLQTPTAGEVLLHGRAPQSPDARRGLGYAHEQPALPPTLTAREVLEYHLALLDLGPESVEHLLAQVQLKDTPRRVATYSKGMRQRLTLAIALAGDPATLILDEPMSGLDPVGRALVRDIILQQRLAGKTILFSSHILSDIAVLCDKIVVIREGKLVLDEPVASSATPTWCIQLRDGETTTWAERLDGVVSVDGPNVFVTGPAVWHVCNVGQQQGVTIRGVQPREIDLERRILPLLVTNNE